MELYEITARVLAQKIKDGEVSSEDATRSVINRIERMEPAINAYITVMAEKAIDRARAIDSRRVKGEDIGPLGGVPMAIKDNIIIDGILVECPEPGSPYGIKGVGEIGLVPTAGAVAAAMQNRDGEWRNELPLINVANRERADAWS